MDSFLTKSISVWGSQKSFCSTALWRGAVTTFPNLWLGGQSSNSEW